MAKTATMLEQGLLPVNGKWVWKDETNTLEYVSTISNAEKRDRRQNNTNADRRDRRQKPGIHFQDGGKRNDRGMTPNMNNRAYGMGRGRGVGLPGHRSPRGNAKSTASEHTHVTLDDVKNVALDMLSEVELVAEKFETLFGTEQLDEFLMYLINYFACFFEKRTHEQKPNPMNIEPSAAEKHVYADLCAKLEVTQKWLGHAYGVLVMGMGLEDQHHMACGMSRVSSTYQDRDLYETLYSFCTFVVWITFRRKESYDIVRREIGRMLRSDTFNPAIRVKNAPDPEPVEEEGKEGEKKEKKKEKKLTPAEYRRLQGKRPAIKSIINQRSPALVSILPSPKEKAHWLFRRAGALSPTSLATIDRDNEDDNRVTGEGDPATESGLQVNKFKIGIIGELRSLFNAVTLTPLGADNEENEEEEEEGKGTPNRGEGNQSGRKTPQDGLARQNTALSHTTTEAFSDED